MFKIEVVEWDFKINNYLYSPWRK